MLPSFPGSNESSASSEHSVKSEGMSGGHGDLQYLGPGSECSLSWETSQTGLESKLGTETTLTLLPGDHRGTDMHHGTSEHDG